MTSTDLEKALHEVRYAEGLPSSSALSLGMPSVADLDSLKGNARMRAWRVSANPGEALC